MPAADFSHSLRQERLTGYAIRNRPDAHLTAVKSGQCLDAIGIKLAGQFFGVGMPDTEGYQRADIAEDRGAHRRRNLIEVLMPDDERQAVLAGFGQNRGECLRSEIVEFIEVGGKVDPLLLGY